MMNYKSISKKIISLITVYTMLQSYLINFFAISFAEETPTNSGTETHNNFTSVLIKEGSENGTVIADLLNGDAVNIDVNKDYYLCIDAKTPVGTDDGFFTISLGKDKPNGLVYTNIPGQVYKAGTIDSDAFDELTAFEEIANYTYGSSNVAYGLNDGTLKYKIKDTKMNSSESGTNDIYAAFGFKLDEAAWNGIDKTILSGIQYSIGNSSGVTDSMSLDVGVNSTKSMYVSNGTTSMDARAGVTTNYLTYSLSVPNSASPVIYDELGYTITYPADVDEFYSSFSSSNLTSMTQYNYGKITIGDPITNADGTITRKVTIGPGYKASGGISGFQYISFKFKEDVVAGTEEKVTIGDWYYIPAGTSEKVTMLTNNNVASKTVTYKIIDSTQIVDKTTISSVNRYSSSNAPVYNWNINRNEDNLLKTAMLIGGAILKNPDTVQTYYEKTIKVNYNITNENANVSIISLPVGVDENDKRVSSITVKYTGIDEDGNIVSGEYTPTKYWGSSPNYYTIIRAVDLGIVSFKSIEADIGHLATNSTTSTWTSYNSFSSNMFAAYGYFTDDTVGNRIKCTFEVSNTDSSAPDNTLKTTSISDSCDNAKTSAVTNFSSGETKETISVVAGNSVTLKNKTINVYGNISKTNGNSSVLARPEVILKLPKGMSFSNLSFSLATTNSFWSGTKVTPLDFDVSNITYLNTTDDGYNLYKVTFDDEDLVIGAYVNEDGDSASLRMTVTFNTVKNMTTQVYDFNDLVNITSEYGLDAGHYENYSPEVADTYGVNDGLALMGSRYKNATITGVSVQRLDSITVDNAISIKSIDGKVVDESTRTWDTYDSSNQNSISYMGLNTEGQYRLRIQNPSSSIAENLNIIIPIPKEGDDFGTAFTNGENEFNMTLTPSGDLDGYSYKYIKLDGNYEASAKISDMTYTEVDSSEANAILLTKDVVDASSSSILYFDFVVTNDATVSTGDFNVWRNNFEYQLDGVDQAGNGSYVAAEIATCKITGNLFEDANGNDRKDDGENSIEGVTVVATDSLGRVQSVKTDSDGNYSFENVREDDIDISMQVTSGNYVFNGTVQENNGEIYNNVTPSSNNKIATTKIHASGDEVVVNGAVSSVYTITYDKGYGTGTAPSSQSYVKDSTATIATPPSGMIITGSEFIGWSTQKVNTGKDTEKYVEYKAGDIINVSSDMTLYAVYKQKNIKITFDYRDGGIYKTVDGETQNIGWEYKYVTYGSKYNAADSDGKTSQAYPTKDGWVFWKYELPTAAYGSGTKITWGDYVKIEEDTTVRAVYLKLSRNSETATVKCMSESTADSPILTVTDGLSVTGLPASYTGTYTYVMDSSVTLPAGITFDSTKGSFYGTPTEIADVEIPLTLKLKISDGVTVSFPYTVHLKVVPNDITVKTTVEPEGSVVLDSSNSAEITVKAAVSGLVSGLNVNDDNKVTLKATKADGTVVDLGTAEIDEDGNAETKWNASTPDIGTYSIKAEISDLNPGYNLVSNNGVESYVISDRELEHYTVTFDANGYDITDESIVYAEGTKYGTLPSKYLAGYTFSGWYTADDVKITSDMEVTGNITVYAKFTANRYFVKYVTNCDTTIDDKEVDYNQDNLIPSDALVKTGYTFNNWTTDDSKVVSTTDKYSDLVSSDSVTDVTLNANWTANQYTVTYDANGGSIGTSSFKISYENKYESLEKPAKTGYNFVGWIDENGNTVTADTIYNFTKNTTLKAEWQAKTGYTINFNSNGGSTVEAKSNVNWDTVALENVTNPTRAGATFIKWTYNDKDVASTDTYGGLAKNDKYESITLNAVWDVLKYTVKLNQGTGYKVENVDRKSEVDYGNSYKFRVVFDNGYIKGDDFKVIVNGKEVSIDENGYYTIENITENMEVSVSGVVDNRKPTGEIKVDDTTWTELSNDIEFKKFYNQAKSVTVAGSYEYGANPTVEYAIASSTTDVSSLSWNTYNTPIDLLAEGKYIIYARITSDNGAIAYVSSDGIVIDMNDPVVEGIEDGGRYCGGNTKITVSDAMSGIDTVKVDETVVTANEDGTYSIHGDGPITVTVTDKAGNSVSYTIEVYDDHDYEVKIHTDPTCTEDGITTSECSVCKQIKKEVAEKLGHDWSEWTILKDATEDEEGLKQRTCARCNKVEQVVIPKVEHVHEYSTEWTIDSVETCTTDGEKSRHCRCGDRIDIIVIPALGHDWSEWTVVSEATEYEAGLKERACSRCNEVEQESIPKLDHFVHVYSDDWTVDVEATCTTAGEKSRHCKCGERTDVTEIPALGHEMGDWVVATEQNVKGYTIYVKGCSRCSYVETKAIKNEEQEDSNDSKNTDNNAADNSNGNSSVDGNKKSNISGGKPNELSTESSNNVDNYNGALPKTGDNVIVYVAGIGLAIGVMIIVIKKRKDK